MDSILTRWELARHQSSMMGFNVGSFQMLSTLLLRAIGLNGSILMQILQPFGGRLPTTQAQYDQLHQQLRTHGHLWERHPGNLNSVLSTGNRGYERGYHMEDSYREGDEHTQTHYTDNWQGQYQQLPTNDGYYNQNGYNTHDGGNSGYAFGMWIDQSPTEEGMYGGWDTGMHGGTAMLLEERTP